MTKKIMLRKFFFLGGLLFVAQFSSAQTENKNSQADIESLQTLANSIQHSPNDSVRISANKIFQHDLREILLQSTSYDFDSVKNISILTSPDKDFRIFTWTLPSYEGSYSYFGFIQIINQKTHVSTVVDLVDSTYTIEKPEVAKLNASKWFGAVYYKMIVNKKDKKNYYTLLGWKGKSPLSTQKVIDVLYFQGDKPQFGFPLFKTENVYRNRLIYEFASQAVMSLRYEESKKMIVFDHLSSPSKKKDETVNIVLGPDGSYDALKLSGGKWVLLRDIDIRTDWKPKVQPKEPQMHEAPVEMMK